MYSKGWQQGEVKAAQLFSQHSTQLSVNVCNCFVSGRESLQNISMPNTCNILFVLYYLCPFTERAGVSLVSNSHVSPPVTIDLVPQGRYYMLISVAEHNTFALWLPLLILYHKHKMSRRGKWYGSQMRWETRTSLWQRIWCLLFYVTSVPTVSYN